MSETEVEINIVQETPVPPPTPVVDTKQELEAIVKAAVAAALKEVLEQLRAPQVVAKAEEEVKAEVLEKVKEVEEAVKAMVPKGCGPQCAVA